MLKVVKRISVDEIFDRIINGKNNHCSCSYEQCLERVKGLFGSSDIQPDQNNDDNIDDGVKTSSIQISMRCPLGLCEIQVNIIVYVYSQSSILIN